LAASCSEIGYLPSSLLAVQHRLTVHDAAYLELAIRLQLPLATLDHELRQVAVRQILTLLGE
jgi:predicted nucleic acid-binding protein